MWFAVKTCKGCMYGEMYDTSDHGGLHMYVCMHVWRDV